MRRKALVAVLAAALMAAALPATGAVHEITGADCNGRGGVNAPGQDESLQALRATGFIASVVFDDDDNPTVATVTFDFSVPSSKYIGAGIGPIGPIPDGFDDGIDLILSDLPIPDPTFPAFENCPLFGLGGA